MNESTAVSDIESVDELGAETRADLHDLILALADSKRILGIRFSDWVLGAPELEASIAASSIAQDEWGHSRILYALLKDFGDDPMEVEHGREAAGYRNIEVLDELFATWQDFVVANALTDTALTTQLEALTGCRYAPLRQRVRKQLEEERFHFAHGAAWFRRFGTSGDAGRSALRAAVDARWRPLIHWFGPEDHGANLAENGFCDGTGDELRDRFLQRIGRLFEQADIDLPSTDLDFSDWNPATRRFSTSGPDSDALARARGDRNRAFLMD